MSRSRSRSRAAAICAAAICLLVVADSALASFGAINAPVFPGMAAKFMNFAVGSTLFTPTTIRFDSQQFAISQNATQLAQDEVLIRAAPLNHTHILGNVTPDEVLNSAPFANFTQPNMVVNLIKRANTSLLVYFRVLAEAPTNPTGSYLAVTVFMNGTQLPQTRAAAVFINNSSTLFGSTNTKDLTLMRLLRDIPAGTHSFQMRYTTLGTGNVFAIDGDRELIVREIPTYRSPP